MTALVMTGDQAQLLRRLPLGDTGGRNERWLQQLLFAHPELLPIAQIDPGADRVVPLARELALARPGGTVFLDMLGVTPQGRLVLVECKLWRNPQARREVVGQILEYAALLRRWSYADLTAQLRGALPGIIPNPVFAAASRLVPSLAEAPFVDAVSRSLRHADFSLVIAGDGIRSDLTAIAEMMRSAQAGISRLALVEVQLWSDGEGRTVVLPSLALRTDVIEHRVVTDQAGTPLRPVEEYERAAEAVERQADPAASVQRAGDRAFWQRFIDTTRFDHPDQPSASHGGRNWVRMPLPRPARWLTAYRSGVAIAGVFLALRGEEGRRAWEALSASLAELRAETSLPLEAKVEAEEPFDGSIGVLRRGDFTAPAGEAAALGWLQQASNAMVTALRPRLAAMERELPPQLQ